jgi:hypothetical protein
MTAEATDRWAEFRRLDFIPSRIPALDALVTFVPEGQTPSEAVQATLRRIGFSRWYPTRGGHYLVVPYEGGQYDSTIFRVREKAWDHETCSGCRAHVRAMTPCWVTSQGPFKLLCQRCWAEMTEASNERT